MLVDPSNPYLKPGLASQKNREITMSEMCPKGEPQVRGGVPKLTGASISLTLLVRWMIHQDRNRNTV
jgi:hypothetical protein